MEKSKIDQETVDWRPQWEGDDLKKFKEYKDGFHSQVANLRELRSALGLSQTEAAARLMTSQSNVSKIEAKSDPSVSTLRNLLGDDGKLMLVALLNDGSKVEISLD